MVADIKFWVWEDSNIFGTPYTSLPCQTYLSNVKRHVKRHVKRSMVLIYKMKVWKLSFLLRYHCYFSKMSLRKKYVVKITNFQKLKISKLGWPSCWYALEGLMHKSFEWFHMVILSVIHYFDQNSSFFKTHIGFLR